MANERLILAIAHMERALTRLETVQAEQIEAPAPGNSEGTSDLAERHDRLKVAAAEALAGIDALLTNKG